MTTIPRELQDELAAFAAGVRPWDEWRAWFATRAHRLARHLDRTSMAHFKRAPAEAVARLLADGGVTVDTTTPPHDEAPERPISFEEYAVFTAVCYQSDLFLFHNPDLIFESHTRRHTRDRARPSLRYDEAQRQYSIVPPVAEACTRDALKYWQQKHPEMGEEYRVLNLKRWPLAEAFASPGGYHLRALGKTEADDSDRAAFCFSRVGFARNQDVALVSLSYGTLCAYYLILERHRLGWQYITAAIAWVT